MLSGVCLILVRLAEVAVLVEEVMIIDDMEDMTGVGSTVATRPELVVDMRPLLVAMGPTTCIGRIWTTPGPKFCENG